MNIVASSCHATKTPRDGLLLVVRDESGLIGVGEASPLPGYSPDRLADCLAALSNVHTRIGSLSLSADPIESVRTAIHDCASALATLPSAQFALETALFDLFGKRTHRSVAQCLGGECLFDVELSALVPLDGDEHNKYIGSDINTIKIKLGRDDRSFANELDLLRHIRGGWASPLRIRLDANGSFPRDEVRARLDQLAEIEPEFVEEPISGEFLANLGRCAVPWAVDESLLDRSLTETFVGDSACAVVVLKPGLLGGLIRTREIALKAIEHGRSVVITHMFDGPIALASACELARSLPCPPLACGLVAHRGIASIDRARLPHFAKHTKITAPAQPGLGFDPRITWVLS